MNMPATHLVAAQFFAIKMVLDERLEISFILLFAQHKCEFGKSIKFKWLQKTIFNLNQEIFLDYFVKVYLISILRMIDIRTISINFSILLL